MPTVCQHFKYKPTVNRLFACSNRLRHVYSILLIGCAYHYLPTLSIDKYSSALISSSSSASSAWSKIWYLFEDVSARRCSSSSLFSDDNIHGHTAMGFLITLLYVVSICLTAYAQWIYSRACRGQLAKPSRWYRWCLNILICLAAAAICNQLVSALSCRPIEILLDIRYTSMLIVQIFGFVICLLAAFFLGVKYASVKEQNR